MTTQDFTEADADLGAFLAESAARHFGPEPATQCCAFCSITYTSDGLRPRAVCATCWPEVRAIERKASRVAVCGSAAQ